MRKSTIALLATVTLLGGCAQNIYNTGTVAPETSMRSMGSSDIQSITDQMIRDMLASPAVSAMEIGYYPPVIFVDGIKNNTSDHIDTRAITHEITRRIVDSDHFSFAEPERIQAIRQQLNFQSDDQLVNQSTAIQFGKMIGAKYMLYGNVTSMVKQDSATYYKMTLRLMDLKSGLIEWSDTKTFPKQSATGFDW